MPTVYVTGHRNPDTDSIAAAIGYAELKAALDPSRAYVPVRLGDLNPQTAWALEQAGAPVPAHLPHIYLRVADVMRAQFPVARGDEPVRDVGRTMVAEGLDLLPVVEDGALAGVLTERSLARRYVRDHYEVSRLDEATAVTTLARVLHGELLCGDEERFVDGRVWVLAMATGSILRDVQDGDIAVVGDRSDAQLRAVELGVGALVLSNGVAPADGLLDRACDRGTPVISSDLDSYVAARMVTLAAPCRALVDREPLTARVDDLVADIAEEIKDVSYRAAVVIDRGRAPVGLVTRGALVAPRPRQVILVDHAERAQSVPGIEHAEILEILDHHHIGSIETKLPVTATFDPVGSTSTLVAERFAAGGIEPARPTATMLLAAILSDTVILNSPTTTDRDRVAAERLAGLTGREVEAFGRDLFRSSSDVSGVAGAELVRRDAKIYDLGGGATLCIAQVETVGNGLSERLPELREALAARRERDGHRVMALMLTDILAKGTQLLVAGDVALAERALGADAVDGVIELPGVMSRKKQVAPRLLGAT